MDPILDQIRGGSSVGVSLGSSPESDPVLGQLKSSMPSVASNSIVTAVDEGQPSGLSPLQQWGNKGFLELEAFRNDIKNVVKEPQAMLAQMRVGLEKELAGNQLSAQDYSLEHSSIYDTPEEILAKRNKTLEGLKETKALEEGINLSEAAPKSYLGKLAQGVTGSIGMQLPTMPLMILAPASAPLLLSSMYHTTYGDKYQERILQGYSPEQADQSANWHGATEVATEMIGLPFLTKALKAAKTAGMSLAKPMIGELLTETVGELTASNLQSGEDRFLSAGKGDKGWNAVSKWINSPEWRQEMLDTAISTVMQTGAMGAGLSPIKASYRNLALKQSAMLDLAIQEARANGQDTIDIVGNQVAVADLENQLKDLSSTWEIDSAEVSQRSTALAEEQSNPVAAQNQLLVDKALESVKQTVETEEIENAQSTEAVDSGTDNGTGDGINEAVGNGIEGVSQDANLPNVQRSGESLAGAAGTVAGDGYDRIGEFQNSLRSTELGSSIFNTDAIPDHAANVFERIQAKLGFGTKKTVMISSEELAATPFGNYLTGLMQEKGFKNVDQVSGGKFYYDLLDNETGKSFHVAVLNSSLVDSDLGGLVGAHEVLGHAVDREHFDKAPETIRNYVQKQFEDTFAQIEAGGSFANSDFHQGFFEKGVLDAIGGAGADQILAKREGEDTDLYKERMYREWKAHQIVKAIFASKPAQSIIERFWAKLADKIKTLYAAFKGDNLDVVSGVSSIRDFVDYLYQTQNGVENFNINDKSHLKGLVQSILNTVATIEDGKFSVKPEWLVKNLKTGKVASEIRKFKTRYLQKGGSFTSENVRSKHAQDSEFTIKKIEGGYELLGPIPFKNEKGFVELKPGRIFALTKEQVKSFGGHGPSNSAFYLMQNIRDLLIIADSALSKPAMKKPNLVEGFLQTREGKAIKVKVDSANKFLTEIYQAAVLLAPENDMSSAQMFLHLITKDFGANAGGIKGATGVAIPENDVIFERMERRIKILNKLAPELPEKITSFISQNQIVEKAPSEHILEVGLKEELKEAPPAVETSPELLKIENQVDEVLEGIVARAKKKFDGLKAFDELGWRYLNELSGSDKNYAEAYAKQKIEEILGSAISIQLKDNVKLEAIKEINQIGGRLWEGDELRVYHGTSKVVQDVPTMDKADPNGLYGPGIYTTEDHKDAETGHLIVTAGYAGPGGDAYTGLKGATPQERTDNALAFETAINKLMHTGTARDKIIADRISKEITGSRLGYAEAVETAISNHMDVLPLIKDLFIGQYIQTPSPNILPLEIDPKPSEVFDIDAVILAPIASALLRSFNPESTYTGMEIYEKMEKQFGSKQAVNARLVMSGFNFITHVGGNITGGVSHKVWIALKDGLVKSAFAPAQADELFIGQKGYDSFVQSPTAEREYDIVVQQYQDIVDGKKRIEMDTAYFALSGRGMTRLKAKTINPGVGNPGVPLKNLLELDWLYYAYPEFKYIQVVPRKYASYSSRGAWHVDIQTIYFNQDMVLNQANVFDFIETLFHELQHAVQDQEGFAGGSNENWWETKLEELQGRVLLEVRNLSYAEEVLGVLENQGLSREEFMARAKNYFDLDNRHYWEAVRGTINSWDESPRGMYKYYGMIQEQKRKAEKQYMSIPQDAYQAYLRVAGEQEARRAASRVFMTMAEKQSLTTVNGDPKNIDRIDTIYVLNHEIVDHAGELLEAFEKDFDVEGASAFRVSNDISDSLANDLVGELYADELALDPSKLRKKARPTLRVEGPYAQILNQIAKTKKRKPRKKPDPVKLKERRDKMNDFITNMNSLKAEGERQGKSLTEYLVSTGKLSNEQIKKMVGKYLANVSRFSQTEIIMRLARHAGLVDETGTDKLAFFIKSIFDAQRVPELQEDGTSKDVMHEGSDGTVQSLGTLGKEILIHRLQNVILQATGETYDAQSEQTVGERLTELRLSEKDRSPWARLKGFLNWIENDWASRLSKTQAGAELTYRLKRYMWKTIDYQRDWLLKLGDFAKEFESVEQREHLYKLLTGDAVALTQREEEFVSMIGAINQAYSREMEVLQVKIQYKNGATEFFKHSSSEAANYFPHMWKPEDFLGKNEKMIQSLIESGEAADTKQALKLIKSFRNSQIRSQKFANIEMARETELGGWITDPIEVYQKYVTGTARRLAQLREFGATPEIALAQMALKHFKEANDSEALDDATYVIKKALGVKVEEGILKDPRWLVSYGMLISTGLLLQHAVFVQPGTATNMAMVGGFSNLLKGVAKVLPALWHNRSAQYQVEYAKVAGVLAFTANKELYDIVLDDKIREKGDKVVRSFGITQIDSMMRIIGAITGKLYATELAIDYARMPSPKREAKLKRLGISPESVLNRENPGVLNEQELRKASLAFTEETNFVINPLTEPVMLKGHPLGRIFMLFSRFAFQQHHLWKTVFRDDKVGVLRGILAGFTVGTPMLLLKMLLTGDDPEKVLEKDGFARFLWKAFSTGSGVGLFAEVFGNFAFNTAGKRTGNTGKGGLAIDSPAFGVAENITKGLPAAYKVLFTDTDTQADRHDALKGSIMALQVAALSNYVPDKIGIPINALLGLSRPLVEKSVAPTKSQEAKTYLR